MATNRIHKKSKRYDLICMGRVGIDLFLDDHGNTLYDHDKNPGHISAFKKYLGGTPGNISVGCARLGLKVAMLSCVGDDDMGKFLLKTLEKERVDTRFIRKDPDHLTGLVLLGVEPPYSRPQLFYRENCADMNIKREHVSEDFFKSSGALLITGTGLSKLGIRVATHHAIKIAKKNNLKIVLDIDYRPVLWGLTKKADGENRYIESGVVTNELQKIIGKTDLIVGTEKEMKIAGGSRKISEAIKKIQKSTNAVLALKRGIGGCRIIQKDAKSITIKSCSREIVNLLGAGDAFMVGFLHGWLRGEELRNCGEFGNACAAYNIARHGCSAAMPTFDELQTVLKEKSNRGG